MGDDTVTTTSAEDVELVVDATQPEPDDPYAGRLLEVEPGIYRWDCGQCPGRSVGTYDGIAAAWDGLRRHHEAIRPEVHR